MDLNCYVLYKNAWVNRCEIHRSEKLNIHEQRQLLSGGGYLVRNIYNWDKKEEGSFWYIVKDTFDGFDELPAKVRNQVRKSLKTYDFKKVTKEWMQAHGLLLFNKSRERFGGKELQIDEIEWEEKIGLDHAEFWVGFEKESGEPASFAINQVYDDYCSYATMGISPDVPNSTYPMYGLIYEMNRYYLEEQKLMFVTDGARTISGHSNIQSFLEDKFKFRKAYCDMQLIYQPVFGLCIKLLFPFRKLIKEKRISALLNQEAMARNIL